MTPSKPKLLSAEEMKAIQSGEIRKYRDEKCFSQEFMANQLGITQSAYQKIEVGDVKISMERLMQIAAILEKKPEDFLGNNPVKSKDVSTGQAIFIHQREWDLLQKVVLQQEKRIEELEAKIGRKDSKIEELKQRLAVFESPS